MHIYLKRGCVKLALMARGNQEVLFTHLESNCPCWLIRSPISTKLIFCRWYIYKIGPWTDPLDVGTAPHLWLLWQITARGSCSKRHSRCSSRSRIVKLILTLSGNLISRRGKFSNCLRRTICSAAHFFQFCIQIWPKSQSLTVNAWLLRTRLA